MAKRAKKVRQAQTDGTKPRKRRTRKPKAKVVVSAHASTEPKAEPDPTPEADEELRARPTIPEGAMAWISADEGKKAEEPEDPHELDDDFFREGEALEAQHQHDSIPPVTDDLGERSRWQKGPPPSPELAARRTKLRKMVATVVGFAAMITIGGIGKTLTADEPSNDAVISVAHAGAPTEAAQPAAEPTPEPALEEATTTAAAQPEEPKTEAEPEAVQDEVPEGVDPKKEALKLLNRGDMKGAIPMARAAIARDKSNALPYLYLGTALQMTGKRPEAKEAYSQCVRQATSGPIHECIAMGGRK